MAVLEDLDDAEGYLYAILSDESGLDLAEFCWKDENNADACWRAWAFQWCWYRCMDRLQIDHAARSLGKSVSIQLRGFIFPFIHPGMEMLITAPELIHLMPVTGAIEQRVMSIRLSRELLDRKNRGTGFTHQPFGAQFANGARILGRIPQRDGKGVKGMHPLWLELDEGQDYPEPGWIELNETLRFGQEGSIWRAHGVTTGVRNKFYEYTQPEAGWKVHRLCLPEGTLVYGVDGPFEIQDARIGTQVWSTTRSGQLVQAPVTDVISNGVKSTWKVVAKGGLSLETTPNHPYLILSRSGTRRTRTELNLEWVDAQHIQPGDYIIGCRELDSTGTENPPVEEISGMLRDHSPVREVPDWVWRSPRSTQLAFLAGYLMGDGSLSHQPHGQDPWQITTASLKMGKQLRALCHYLGLRTTQLVTKKNEGSIPASRDSEIHGFYVYPDASWFKQIPLAYSSVRDGRMLEGLDKRLIARRVESSGSSGRSVPTYDITVDEHHNYIAEGVVVHNTAMHRPDWSAEEREQKALLYGGRNSSDYKRNILGEHGDQANPLFVLARLMACVDPQQGSSYNQDEYIRVDISHEKMMQYGLPIEEFIKVPAYHRQYPVVWIGMDVGMTNHPTEILVFAEEAKKTSAGKDASIGQTVMKLVSRWHLERISAPDQRKVLRALYNVYKPKGISLDKTGVGLPIYQDMMVEDPIVARVVKGYNFSAKIPVDWEDADNIAETLIERNVLEYASDKLREFVDAGWIKLPWDLELIKEWQGQSYTVVKTTTNPYGKREYSKGTFHSLDAGRMAILGKVLDPIEKILYAPEYAFAPVLDVFYGD